MRRIWNVGEAPVAVVSRGVLAGLPDAGTSTSRTTGSMTDRSSKICLSRLVRDPTAVIDDPLIELPTGEDRRFLFLVEEMAKEEF